MSKTVTASRADMKAFYHDESQNPETEIDNLREDNGHLKTGSTQR
jgi:hypothetical protein